MPAWTPAYTASPLWIDFSDASTLFNATSGGSVVTNGVGIARAEDKSGNGRHFTQATPGNRPLWRSGIQNGLGIARFDGVDDWIESTFVAWGSQYAILAVAMGTNASSGSGGVFASRSNSLNNPVSTQIAFIPGSSAFVLRDDAAVANSSSISSLLSNQFYLFGGVRDNNNVTSYRDGVSGSTVSNTLGTITANRSSFGALYQGSLTPRTFLNGDIAELVIVPITARVLAEGYLAWKWGLQANLPSDHPYKNAAPLLQGGRRRRNSRSYGL